MGFKCEIDDDRRKVGSVKRLRVKVNVIAQGTDAAGEEDVVDRLLGLVPSGRRHRAVILAAFVPLQTPVIGPRRGARGLLLRHFHRV